MTTEATLLTELRQVSLAVFRCCLIEKDYSGLGEGTPEEIADAWLNIYSDYCARRGGVKLKMMLMELAELQALASRIERIQILIDTCRGIADEDLAQMLRDEGYRLDVDALPDVYSQQLDIIKAKLAPDCMRRDRLKRDIDQPQRETDEAKERAAIEEDFEITLIELSRFMKFEIKDDVTMLRFCNMIDRMTAHVKAQAKGNG